jgi:hypothetical protein
VEERRLTPKPRRSWTTWPRQAGRRRRWHRQRTDPDGAILWSHPHDPGNDLNCGTPLFGPDNVLFVSSAYQAGSRALRLTQTLAGTEATELWFTNRVRFMFLSAVRIGDFVYGTTGDFGPDSHRARRRWAGRVAAPRLRRASSSTPTGRPS